MARRFQAGSLKSKFVDDVFWALRAPPSRARTLWSVVAPVELLSASGAEEWACHFDGRIRVFRHGFVLQ